MAAFSLALLLAMLFGCANQMGKDETANAGKQKQDNEEMSQLEKEYWDSPHMRH